MTTTIGVIGVGLWGTNLLEMFRKIAYVKWAANKHDISRIQNKYPDIRTTLDYHDILANDCVDAVVIAVPHKDLTSIAIEALDAGKHVFLEKPCATNYEEILSLKEASDRHPELVLFPGYHRQHHPYYKWIQQDIKKFSPVSMDIVWLKYGTFGNDLLLNLFSHELYMMIELFGLCPGHVSIVRQSDDLLHAILRFGDSECSVIIDRVSPECIHSVRVTQQCGSILIWNDDLLFLRPKFGDIQCVGKYVSNLSALDAECLSFLKCISKEFAPPKLDTSIKVIEIIDSLSRG